MYENRSQISLNPVYLKVILNKLVLLDFSLTVKAAPHECVSRGVRDKRHKHTNTDR